MGLFSFVVTEKAYFSQLAFLVKSKPLKTSNMPQNSTLFAVMKETTTSSSFTRLLPPYSMKT